MSNDFENELHEYWLITSRSSFSQRFCVNQAKRKVADIYLPILFLNLFGSVFVSHSIQLKKTNKMKRRGFRVVHVCTNFCFAFCRYNKRKVIDKKDDHNILCLSLSTIKGKCMVGVIWTSSSISILCKWIWELFIRSYSITFYTFVIIFPPSYYMILRVSFILQYIAFWVRHIGLGFKLMSFNRR